MEDGTQEDLTASQEDVTSTQEDVTGTWEDVPDTRNRIEDAVGGRDPWPLLRHISQLSQLSLEEGQQDPGRGRAVSVQSGISITSNSEFLRWQNSQVLDGAAALLEAVTVRCHRYYVIAFLEPGGGEGGRPAEAAAKEEDSARRRKVMFHSVTPLLAEGEGGQPMVVFTLAMRTEAGRLCSIDRWVAIVA